MSNSDAFGAGVFAAMSDPLKPSIPLLVKLGSLVVHADEYFSPGGHEFDKQTFQSAIHDPEVQAWLQSMNKMAMLPVKR